MSTHCSIQVVEQDRTRDRITLYQHSDGYPTVVLPTLLKAWELGQKIPKRWGLRSRSSRDMVFRLLVQKLSGAGYAAGFICAAAPGDLMPEAGHDLPSDIEWFYHVQLRTMYHGQVLDVPRWYVVVYVAGRNFEGGPMLQGPTVARLRAVAKGWLDELNAKKIEDEVEQQTYDAVSQVCPRCGAIVAQCSD